MPQDIALLHGDVDTIVYHFQTSLSQKSKLFDIQKKSSKFSNIIAIGSAMVDVKDSIKELPEVPDFVDSAVLLSSPFFLIATGFSILMLMIIFFSAIISGLFFIF
jgi:hypothetical protein